MNYFAKFYMCKARLLEEHESRDVQKGMLIIRKYIID